MPPAPAPRLPELFVEPLALAVLLPVLVAIVLAVLVGVRAPSAERNRIVRTSAMVASLIQAGLLLLLVAGMVVEPEVGQRWSATWNASLGIEFHLQIDGVGVAFAVLAALGLPLCLCAPWPRDGSPMLVPGLFLLQATLVGLSFSGDVLTFTGSWYAMALIVAWLLGPSQRWRFAAPAIVAGTLLMLAALRTVVGYHEGSEGRWATDFDALGSLLLPYADESFGLWAALLAAMVHLGILPAHAWTQRAIERAPHPVAIAVVAVVRPAGVLVLLRFAAGLHATAFAEVADLVAIVATVAALHGAASTRADRRVPRWAGGLSAVHVSLAVVGVASGTVAGWMGAVMLALGHGIAMTGLMLGATGVREAGGDSLAQVRGLRTGAPRWARRWLASGLAAAAFPASLSFVGVVGVLVGTLESDLLSPGISVTAALGGAASVLVAGGATLRLLLDTVTGQRSARLRIEAFRHRRASLGMLVATLLCAAAGIWNGTLGQRIRPGLDALHEHAASTRCRWGVVEPERPTVVASVPACGGSGDVDAVEPTEEAR